MAQVTIRINGYSYQVGCENGQEQHLEAMGREVGQRIEEIRASAGPASESRMLVLAALMLADELHDRRRDFDEVRRRVARLETSAASADPKLAPRLDKLARRAEEIAAGLEAP